MYPFLSLSLSLSFFFSLYQCIIFLSISLSPSLSFSFSPYLSLSLSHLFLYNNMYVYNMFMYTFLHFPFPELCGCLISLGGLGMQTCHSLSPNQLFNPLPHCLTLHSYPPPPRTSFYPSQNLQYNKSS